MDFNRMDRGLLVVNAGTAFVVSATAYEANDVVGGLSKVIYSTGGGLLMRGVSIRDDAVQNEPYIIHIYRSVPSTVADAAAMAPTTADGDLEIGTITINAGDYATANGSAYSKAYKAVSDIEVDESSGGTFYVYMEFFMTS